MQPRQLILLLALFTAFWNTALFGQCGTERWKTKVLSDTEASQIKYKPIKSTVKKQLDDSLFPKPPYHDPGTRDVTEKRVYKIDCILVKYKVEDDKDWHIVVKDLVTNDMMVVEIPDPSCVNISNTHFKKLKSIRKKIEAKLGSFTTSFKDAPVSNMKIRVIGVGFFDKSNHPAGFKGREIHPVLDFKFL